MTTQTLEQQAGTVTAWRLDVLEHAGYPTDIAVELAENHTIDLHQAVYLMEAGCPLHTAIRILT